MKKMQKGVVALEGLLILIIVGIVAFTGWYVYHVRNNTNANLNSAANTNVAVKGTPKAKASTVCTYSLSLGQQTGAAGTFHQDLIFTNTSNQSCTLNGYPKVTLTCACGTQIGQPADNDTTVTPSAVTVAAGATVHATFSLPNPDIAPDCSDTASTYINATLPGATTALNVASAQQWCPNFLVYPIESGD